MNGINIAANQDAATLHRRISNLERALSSFENLDALVEVQGRGLCRLEIIAKFNGTKKAVSTNLPGGVFRAYVADEKTEKFAIGEGKLITNVVTGEELKVQGIGEWFPIYSNTKVWIKCTTQKFKVTSAKIEVGTTWPEEMIVFTGGADNPEQMAAYVTVGEVLERSATGGEDGFNITLTRGGVQKDFHFDQKIQTNLYVSLQVVDGKIAALPLPFTG